VLRLRSYASFFQDICTLYRQFGYDLAQSPIFTCKTLQLPRGIRSRSGQKLREFCADRRAKPRTWVRSYTGTKVAIVARANVIEAEVIKPQFGSDKAELCPK